MVALHGGQTDILDTEEKEAIRIDYFSLRSFFISIRILLLSCASLFNPFITLLNLLLPFFFH